MKGYTKTAVLTSTVERRLQDAALPEKILKRKKRTCLPLAVFPPQTNFHLLFTSDMRLFPFFVNLSQKASILESPCRYHLKCQFGTCEAYVSQTSVAGVFFLSCLVIIKARLFCSIERNIHC